MKTIRSILKKLSLVDIILILITLSVGMGFYFFFYRQSQTITVSVQVTDQDVLYTQTQPRTFYASMFQVGDTEYDALGKPVAVITRVDSFDADATHKTVFLRLTVKSTYDSRTKSYYLRGQKIVYGAPIQFTLSKIIFNGIVIDFPNLTAQKDIKIGSAVVTILSRVIEPTIATSVVPGDQIIDSNRTVLAQVIDNTVLPAEKVTLTSSGDLLLRYDPLYKDSILTVRLRTTTVGDNTFVFYTIPLKIGQVLPLQFHNVSLSNLNNPSIVTKFALDK